MNGEAEPAMANDRDLESETGPRRAETLMTSIRGTLAAATELLEGLNKVEDLELRRLSGVLAERLKGTRLAFAALESYHQSVYGKDKRGNDQ